MAFDWSKEKRATPEQWLGMLRFHGEALVGKTNGQIVARAESMISPQARTDNAKLGSFARELAFAQEWAVCGFPQVMLSDRLFANFAATAIPHELLPDVGLPWPTFVVRVPESFHEPVNWGLGIRVPIAYMQVRQVADEDGKTHTGKYVLEMKPSDAPGAALSMVMRKTNDAIDPRLDDQDSLIPMDWDAAHGRATGDLQKIIEPTDGRGVNPILCAALRRAFVSILLELSRPEYQRALAARHDVRRGRLGYPKAWTFKITKPVVVDCRSWLKAVARGESGRKLGVQALIRGHWKNQPCGPGGRDRKFIHVEPYWRGPEDAPIAVRPHILRGEAKA